MKNNYKGFLAYVMVFMLVWNLFDFLYTSFFVKNTYVFEPTDLLIPGVIALASGYIFYLRDNK